MYLRFCGWLHVFVQCTSWQCDAAAALLCMARTVHFYSMVLVPFCPRRLWSTWLELESIVQSVPVQSMWCSIALFEFVKITVLFTYLCKRMTLYAQNWRERLMELLQLRQFQSRCALRRSVPILLCLAYLSRAVRMKSNSTFLSLVLLFWCR